MMFSTLKSGGLWNKEVINTKPVGCYLEKWRWFPVPLGIWGGRIFERRRDLPELGTDPRFDGKTTYCFAILMRDLMKIKQVLVIHMFDLPETIPKKKPSNCLIYHALSGYHPLSYTYEVPSKYLGYNIIVYILFTMIFEPKNSIQTIDTKNESLEMFGKCISVQTWLFWVPMFKLSGVYIRVFGCQNFAPSQNVFLKWTVGSVIGIRPLHQKTSKFRRGDEV